MCEKSTGDLSMELMSTPNIDSYIKKNSKSFTTKKLSDKLSRLFDSSNISKTSLARCAGMSEVYLHQVFSGRRQPSRDKLLCICICLKADFPEIQKILKSSGYAPLYPKNKRDSIISFGIIHNNGLGNINIKLSAEGEQPLT